VSACCVAAKSLGPQGCGAKKRPREEKRPKERADEVSPRTEVDVDVGVWKTYRM
jgi:hypothetical protein